MKEYSQNEKSLPTGYMLIGDKIESHEHNLVKSKGKDGEPILSVNSNKKVRPLPERVTNEQLELLIETYIYQYMDKPANMPIHTRNLLSALLELKQSRF